MKEITVKTKGGRLSAMEIEDINYPGIDVEFIPDEESEDNLTRPRVLIEYPADGQLRILVWEDKHNEDYTREIVFDV